jgi:HAD superfamily hydrolase (TIGR01509 family)
MPSPQLVIFDCDGVLIDSETIACRVDAECFAEIGFPVTFEDVRERYVGTTWRTMFADVEARHGRELPVDFIEVIRARTAAAFETELKATQGIEQVLDALTLMKCIASSSGHDRLLHSLTLTGLWDRFAPHIFSAMQVAKGKPAPDLFLFAAAQMGVAPEQCVVIEDSLAGVRAARAAGMRVIGFCGGGHCPPEHAARLREAGASATVAAMPDLMAHI